VLPKYRPAGAFDLKNCQAFIINVLLLWSILFRYQSVLVTKMPPLWGFLLGKVFGFVINILLLWSNYLSFYGLFLLMFCSSGAYVFFR
jgi:hypothetical protein